MEKLNYLSLHQHIKVSNCIVKNLKVIIIYQKNVDENNNKI